MNCVSVPRPRFDAAIERNFFKLPPGRTMGATFGVAIAPNDHIWIMHQSSGFNSPPEATETLDQRLPPVCEFDAEGNYLRAWGGDDQLPRVDGVSQWPLGSENVCIDGDGCIWVFGYTPEDQAAVRFTSDGKFLMRIGQRGKTGTDSSTDLLSTPTAVVQVGREVFFSDGYGAHRVVAFDVDTGKCTRYWGAYGKDPATLGPDESYKKPVHDIAIGPDGLLYVCDRRGNRVQTFDVSDGKTRFVREVVIAPSTLHYGTAFSLAFSPDGAFMYVADATNRRIWIVGMNRFEVLGWFASDPQEGDGNENCGVMPVHRIKSDRQGNLFVMRALGGTERRRFLGVR
jgi:hypothetical protein